MRISQSGCNQGIMQRYNEKIEEEMKIFFKSLNEKDKRRYAAVEALKLGRGGQVYIEEVLGCDRNTIAKGIRELESGEVTQDEGTRIRREGGGRKRAEDVDASIEVDFLNLLAGYTAGDPMNESVKWTNLSPNAIVQRLNEKRDRPVGLGAIRRLLQKHKYSRRQIVKKNDEGSGSSQ
jgi:hypothetical protein